jgi:uncharacterized protein YggE
VAAQEHDGGRAATVTVTGVAAIRTEPDEAFVWVSLSRVDASPGAALADVAKRTNALAQLLDGLAIKPELRSTSGITVLEEFDHTPQGRRSLGHRAVATTSIRLADPELIGRVVASATDELDARVSGPTWRVSLTNPARLEAAREASANAKAKAEAFAAGIDARLGHLISLSEPEDHYVRGVQLSGGPAVAASGPDVHIDTGEQQVAASIQATFALRAS